MKLDIGNTLKKEREKQKLTLEDVAKKTLIREYYLEQIENNEFKQYDGFISAYIRKYGEALGIDSKPLTVAYKALFEEKEEGNKPRSKPYKKRFYIIATALLLSSVFMVVVLTRINRKNPPQNINNSAETTTPSGNELQKPLEKYIPAGSEEKKEESSPPAEKKVEGITVAVSADQLCWIGVTIDGKYTQLFVRKGESKVFKGKKYVKIRFGNATHASVIVNGKDLGVVSKDKKVVEVTYRAE